MVRAITHARKVIDEWREAGQDLKSWSEVHTRYGIVDPILQSLRWRLDDPKVCHPEYPRYHSRWKRVDYALFTGLTAKEIVEDNPPPAIIIEAKALHVDLAARPRNASDAVLRL